MSSHCTYCREVGHTKSMCHVLVQKIEAKKSKREAEKRMRRFTGIVKKFGGSPDAMNALWDEASSIVSYFRNLEKEADGLCGAEFDKMCKILCSLEEEYEDKVAFIDFMRASEFFFKEKKNSEVVDKSCSLYETLSSLSENMPKEISKSSAKDTFNEEELMIRASDHYWKMRYRYGEEVFFGWLNATRVQNSRMKEIFSGSSWAIDKPKDVFKIGENTEKPKTEKPKVVCVHGKKKKSQKDKRKELV